MQFLLNQARSRFEDFTRLDGPGISRLFLALWNLAFLLHFAESWNSPKKATAALFICLVGIFLPSLRWAWLASLLPATGMVIWQLPIVANHVTFVCLVNLTLIGLVLTGNIENVNRLARVLLFGLCALYFIAGFHKLNADFFDPEVSCAVNMLMRYKRAFGLPVQNMSSWFNILPYLGVGLELVIPILLFFRGTFLVGVLSAISLHSFLAPLSFVDFGSLALSVLTLTLLTKQELPREWRHKIARISIYYFVYMFFMAALSSLDIFIEEVPFKLLYLQVLGWELFAGFLGFQVLKYLWLIRWPMPSSSTLNTQTMQATQEHRQSDAVGWGWVLPLVVIVVGSGNYLGLGTAGTFSMFSNVRTEGDQWNHLLMPRWIRIFSYQDNILWVDEIDPDFEEVHHRIPTPQDGLSEFELYRLYARWKSEGRFPTEFTAYLESRPDEIFNVTERFPIEPDRFSWIERKFLYSRGIHPHGPNKCRW